MALGLGVLALLSVLQLVVALVKDPHYVHD